MPRPPLPLDTAGSISAKEVGLKRWRARCRYRQSDGRTIPLERTGPSSAAARRRLQEAIRDLRPVTDEPLRPHHTVERAGELWLRKLDSLVADGRRSATTADLYRGQWSSVVLPAIGQLRISECTVGRMDVFFTDLAGRRSRYGAPLSAKYRQSIKIVVKQVLQLAVKHEALPANPTREVERIEGGRRRTQPRALTAEERRRLFAWFTATDGDEASTKARAAAVRRDLPDVLTLMLGTGIRIGEALALRWADLDLEGVPLAAYDGTLFAQPIAAITGNIVRVKGQGLIRNPGKTERSLRVVPLPRFVSDMLRERRPVNADLEWPVFSTVGNRGRGVTWRDPRNVSGEILEMRQAMGVTWKLTSHTFRKTAATIWHDAGTLSDRQAADLIGHAKVSMLTDVYVHRGELHPEGAAVMDAAWLDS